MKKINFAVIGCGMLARQAHIPNLCQLDEARLHTCCDINEENLARCAPFSPVKSSRDFREAISDPEVDALVVATTEVFRVPIVEAAAAAGKAVYCEKPLADTLANALAMQRLVEQSGIPFCVGHNRRCAPAMVEAREIFTRHMRHPVSSPWRFSREGAENMPIGDRPGAPVVAIRINDDWMSWKPVHLQSELNRKVGLVLSEGTHFADMANWFIDSDPVSVFCAGQGVLNHTMVIKYANGGMATIAMASTGTFAYPKELLEAIGNAGIVAVDHMLEVRTGGIEGAPPLQTYPMLNDRHPDVGQQGGLYGWLEKKRAACGEAAKAGDPMRQFTAEPDKGHKRMLREFIREIRKERDAVCPAATAVLATRVCLAAAKSMEEGRFVDLSEISA